VEVFGGMVRYAYLWQ